jgi:hypothetical protein
MSEEFNGWTNRETWAVALHFDNNGELYKIKNKALANLSHLDNDQKVFILDRILRETIENCTDRANMPKNYDILKDIGSIWRVNWREIAQNEVDELALQVAQ